MKQPRRFMRKNARPSIFFVRRRVWAALLSVVVFGLGIAIFVRHEDSTELQAKEKVALRGYGFSTSLLDLSPTEVNQKLDDMKAAGATWVRFDLSWDAVQQHDATSYDWSLYDTSAKAAVAHGFNVLMIIDFTPPWARPSNCTSSKLCGPARADVYGAFAAEAAHHFGPLGVRHWEIWNEPNIAFRYRPATNPGQYVSMLKSAYPAIKKADPTATVIAGSVAPSASDAGDLTPSDFMRELYARGAGGFFDAISVHPYTYPTTPSQSSPSDAWGQLKAIHDIMASHSEGRKPVWITEVGAPTNGPDKAGEYVSEAVQAQIASEAIRLFRGYSWSGPLLWYDYQDGGTDKSSSEHFYGLVRADGSHKSGYDAFQEAVRTHQ